MEVNDFWTKLVKMGVLTPDFDSGTLGKARTMSMDRAAVAFVKVAIGLGSEGAEKVVIEYSLDVIMLLNIVLVCLMALLSYKGKWRGFVIS